MVNKDFDKGGELFRRIMKSDEQAFEQIHELYKDRLFFYARRFQLEWDEVQDAVSDAFLALWKGRAQLQSDEHIKNFLYIVVRHHALKTLEVKNRQREYVDRVSPLNELSASPDLLNHAAIEAELFQLLHEGIQKLAPDYRIIFELSYYKQKSPQEIARLLNANPATVRSKKRRAVEMLRTWMQERTLLILLHSSMLTVEYTSLKKILTFLARMG